MVDQMGTPGVDRLKPSNKLAERGKKRSPSQSPESSQKKHSKIHHVASGVPQTTVQINTVVAGPDSPSDPQLRRNCNLVELNTPTTGIHEANGSLTWHGDHELSEELSTLVTNTLLQFNEQCALSSAYSVSVSHAEAQLKRTTREYDSNKTHFSAYPAIEEQKGRAKKKAGESLESLKKLVDDQRAKQKLIARRVPETIMNMMKISLQEAHSRTDQMSRDRICQLEEQLKTQREKHLEIQNGFEARLKSMEDGRSKASAEITRCSIETSSVKSKLDTVKKHLDTVQSQLKEKQQKPAVDFVTKDDLSEFQNLINDSVQKIKADAEPKPQPFHPSIDTLISRVNGLEERVNHIKTASDSNEEQLNLVLNSFDDWTGGINKQMVAMNTDNTNLRKSTLEKVEALDQKIIKVDEKFDKKIIDVVAKQPQIVEYEPPRFVPLSPLGSSITNELADRSSNRPQSTRALQDSRSIQAGNGFAPQPAQTSYDPAKIEALQNIARHHQLVLDNLTTDNLHQGFVQHMSNTYPSAKNYESFSNEIKTSLSSLQTELQTQRGLIAEYKAKSNENGGEIESIKTTYDTTIGPDLMEMRKEILTLQERVAKLEGSMRAWKFTGR